MKRILFAAALAVALVLVCGCSCTDSYFSSLMTLGVGKHYCPCSSTCYKNGKHDPDSCGCSKECSCWGGKR